MADAYCGPSNALQNFQKHSSVDRTLQQDRVTSRRSPLENFRSAEPNAGVLDPEFEAFQASQPGPLPFAEPAGLSFHQSLNQRDWASDFQRLQLSPTPLQNQYAPAPLQAQHAPAAQFSHMSTASTNHAPMQSRTPFQFQTQYGGFGGYGGLEQVMMRNNTPIQASQAPVALNDASYDEAFARAFDAAQEEIFSQENASSTDHLQEGMQDTLGRDLSSTMEQEIEQTFDLNDADLLRTRPLESATIEQHDDIKQQDDNDDLARTASELLDKVRHDQSEKFQNSAFLGLMRRLRDREVKVDGDKMVEVGVTNHQT
ncbi:hypothetical protein ANO11243_064990 [Dothideomycetidae sp. 11243]|nr:hypothetical protein ANO11243_064990 [fungal sp. No.11243]